MSCVVTSEKSASSWYYKAPKKMKGAVKEGSFWVGVTSLISSAYSHSRRAIGGAVVQASSEVVYLGNFTLMRLGGLVALPFSFVGLGKDVYDFTRGRDKEDKIEAGLRGTSKVGTILKSVTVATLGVRAIDLAGRGLKISLPFWGGALIGLGTLLELGDAIASGVGAVRTYKLRYELGQAQDTESKLRLLADMDAHGLKKYFRVGDGNKLKAHLSQELARVIVKGDAAKIQADGVLSRLKGRLHVKLASDCVKIAVHLIGVAGLIVLIFTPMAPLGYGLIAASVGMSLMIALIDYAESKKPYRPEDDDKIVKKARHLWMGWRKKLFPNGT